MTTADLDTGIQEVPVNVTDEAVAEVETETADGVHDRERTKDEEGEVGVGVEAVNGVTSRLHGAGLSHKSK